MLSEGLHSVTAQRNGDRALVLHMTQTPATTAPMTVMTARPYLADTGIRRSSPGRPLSRREREILALLCLRLTDLEIADRLYLSRRTVTTHVSNILAKLNVANRREAAAMAGQLLLN